MQSAQLATNHAEAVKVLRANLTPRQIELETLEKYVAGTQYDGRPDWFDASVPLWQRAPCIVYTIAASAIRSNVDLVVGEGRFPALTSNPGEDDSDADGLDEEQSKNVDRAITELCDRARYRSVARQALEHAQASKSVATIVGMRNGRPFLELVRAGWCEPEFDVDGNVTRLVIQYPYLKWNRQPDGSWLLEPLLYRRVIDAIADTEFMPLPCDPDGRPPTEDKWIVNAARTVKAHGLGFCPVRWYAHMRECSSVADIDGKAIHQNLLDEIRALDMTLSQRHRAVMFTGDPQIIETGVEPGYNPSSTGVTSSMPATLQGGAINGSNPMSGAYVDATGGQSARVKSPGIAWQYPDKDTKVDYLVLPAEAIKALEDHGADLRNKISEGLCVVILDPENVKHAAAMSGKAIESLRARQFDRCDQIRDDFGINWLMPVALMLLRVALATKVQFKCVVAVKDILAKYTADDASAPMLNLRWPRSYLKSGPQEEQFTVTAVSLAYEGKLITLRTAVQKLADVFGIENVDQAVEALEEENKKRAADAMAQMQATADSLHIGDKPVKKPKIADSAAA